MSEGQSVERLSVGEAAERLGVTCDAIHKRISRGSIRHELGQDGRHYVWIDTSTIGSDASTDASTDTSIDAPMVELMREMTALTEERITYLERQVEEEREARRRADMLLAQLVQGIPGLEPPREVPTEAPEAFSTATEQPGRSRVGQNPRRHSKEPRHPQRPRTSNRDGGPIPEASGPQTGGERPQEERGWWRRLFKG